MANGDRPPVSLIDRGQMGLDDEELEAVEVESLSNDLESEELPSGIEIITEDDGGVTLDFDPMVNREREDDFYANLAEFMDDRELGSVTTGKRLIPRV
jgi:hypothetical protein